MHRERGRSRLSSGISNPRVLQALLPARKNLTCDSGQQHSQQSGRSNCSRGEPDFRALPRRECSEVKTLIRLRGYSWATGVIVIRTKHPWPFQFFELCFLVRLMSLRASSTERSRRGSRGFEGGYQSSLYLPGRGIVFYQRLTLLSPTRLRIFFEDWPLRPILRTSEFLK